MSVAPPLQTIAVGVVVERTKGTSRWSEFLWRPLSVLVGAPDTPPWTKLSDDGERVTFFVGAGTIDLYRTETTYYLSNLESGGPALWIALRPTGSEPPFTIAAVTADPAEGESLSEPATDLVEQVPMPETIQQLVAAFIAEHHVERAFTKRQRDRADPEALGRRTPHRDEEPQ
jgi:hypothetical protein